MIIYGVGFSGEKTFFLTSFYSGHKSASGGNSHCSNIFKPVLQITLSVVLGSFFLTLTPTLIHLTDIPFTEQEITIDELERKGFISPQVCFCFKEKASEEAPGLCTLLLALLMTQFVHFFFFFGQKPEREKELKCFLLKTLTYSFGAADSVLSDNQDKTARVSSLLRPFPLSIPIPGSCGIPREGQ